VRHSPSAVCFAGALVALAACGKKPAVEQLDASVAIETPRAPEPPGTVPPAMVDPPVGAPRASGAVPESDEIPGAPAATTLPSGFGDLTKTVRLEIKDVWVGLGPTHELVAMLERAPGARTFAVTAKIGAQPYPPLRETARDPTEPRHRSDVDDADRCVFRDAVTGKCEDKPEPPDYKKKNGTVDAATVEAFLAEVATRKIDPKQDHPTGMHWSDDYPTGHVTVWVPGVKDPIHLAFRDQQRHWRVNGAFLTFDPGGAPPKDIDPGGGVHKRINERYRRMLEAMGLAAWVKDVNKGGRFGR
jgi:hypothetical protein